MPRRSLARCTMPRQGLEQHHTVAGRKTFAFLVADDGCARISPPHAGLSPEKGGWRGQRRLLDSLRKRLLVGRGDPSRGRQGD